MNLNLKTRHDETGPSAPRSTAITIRPCDAPLGAEVIGLDLAQPLGEADFRRIHQAHLDHHLLVFRDQRITPEQQIDFSRRFGPLQVHVLHQFLLKDHPEILIVSNIVENGQPIGLGDAGVYWHSDLSYKERPSLGSMLHARELPAEGGDTLFANMHLAWDTLPAPLRRAVEGRRAEHSYLAKYEELRARSPWRPKLSQAQIAEVAPVEHPVVRTHPESGRKALRQRALHDPHRRPARGRKPRAAGATVRPQRAAGARPPAPLAAARHGVLGQPLADAPGYRLPRRHAPAPEPDDDRRRRAVLSRRHTAVRRRQCRGDGHAVA